MKKFLLFLALLIPLALCGQQYKIVKSKELTAGGGTLNIPMANYVDYWYLYGTYTLASSWTVTPTGTAYAGAIVEFIYNGVLTLGVNNLTIFGYSLTDEQALVKSLIFCYYNGAAWQVRVLPGFNESDFIDSNRIIVKNIGNRYLTDMDRGHIKVGNASNRPVDLDASTSGAILIGDGNDLNSVVPAGDVTISTAGVTTIGATKVTAAMMANLTATYMYVGSATNRPVGVSITGDIAVSNVGLTTIQRAAVDSIAIEDGTVRVTELNSGLRLEMQTINLSFETGEQGNYKISLPYKCSLYKVNLIVVKAIAATDSAHITFMDGSDQLMTGSGLVAGIYKIPPSTVVGTEYTITPSAYNEFASTEKLQIVSYKSTVGGKVLITLSFVRQE